MELKTKHIILGFMTSVLLLCGVAHGQDSVQVSNAPVHIPAWDKGFRIGMTTQAQLVLPASLTADDPYMISLPGFGGELGVELSYHFSHFGVSLGLNFGTFRVFNFKPHFDDAPGADLDDPDFWWYNQFHHYSMIPNLLLPLKFEFHYPFNDKLAIVADIGAKFAFGYKMDYADGDIWISTYEDIAMKPLYVSLVTDVGLYYRLPYGDLIRGSVGANVGFQHVSDGEYQYKNPGCNVQGEGTFFTRNTNFNLQVAYIHTFRRYKQRRATETWQQELPRHEFQFNVGDPVLAVNSSSIGFSNFFSSLFQDFPYTYSAAYWTQPIGDYPITRFVPTFSFNYHYRATKWFWVGGLTTVTGLHNTWHDRFSDEITGHGSEVHFTCMPDLRFSYFNRKHVTLYSGFGLGLKIISLKDPHQYDDKTHTFYRAAYQLTAFGVKAGAKHWFGNVELGLGYKGFLSAGFGYEF